MDCLSHKFSVMRLHRLAAFLLSLLVIGSTAECGIKEIKQAAFREAAERGRAYLRKEANSASAAQRGLLIYALIKAEEPKDSRIIIGSIAVIQKKIREGVYYPMTHHNYEAGTDLMALEATDPVKYMKEIEIVADYLISHQKPYGAWDYVALDHKGDTSISQYAVLGLWAAKRAGVTVPLRTWDGAATWHMKSQDPNGGFQYQPNFRSGNTPTTHSMGVAGVGSMYVIRMNLSASGRVKRTKKKEKNVSGRPFGILETVDSASSEDTTADDRPAVDPDESYSVRTSLSSLDNSLADGDNWIAKNFTIDEPTGWPIYYLYGLERYGALSGLEQIDGHDWYEEGGRHLVEIQRPQGYWRGRATSLESTCFAMLFLTRSTSTIVKQPPRAPAEKLGGGLLAGGRGLPDDLTLAKTDDGKVTSKKVKTPLDRLLADLAQATDANVGTTQKNLVASVQLGNREELIGQKDQLLKLVKNPNGEVRRTAIWALGRCEDLRLAPLMIQAIKDGDVDTMIEARNALCVLSQLPNGFNRYRKVTLKVKRDGTLVMERVLFRGQERKNTLTHDLYLSQLKLEEGDRVAFLVESNDGSGNPQNIKNTPTINIRVFKEASTGVINARLDADKEELASKKLDSHDLVQVATVDNNMAAPANGIIPIRVKVRNPDALPDNPLANLPKDATAKDRTATVTKWRQEMVRRWTTWYRTVRPYDERDDLGE